MTSFKKPGQRASNRGVENSDATATRYALWSRIATWPRLKSWRAINNDAVVRHIRGLLWTYRRRLFLGAGLTLLARLSALVVPASSKYLIDEVILRSRADLLPWLAAAVGAATLLQLALSLSLAQLFGVTGQKATTDLRRRVHEHVLRLPTGYFDSTKSGALVSRILTDTEAAKMIVGSGVISLFGSLITATAALAILFYLNWQLAALMLVILGLMSGTTLVSCLRLRPLFQDRGRLQADLMGRLHECVGGIRVVKTCTAEAHQRLVFAKDLHALFRNMVRTVVRSSVAAGVSNLIISSGSLIILVVGGNAVLEGRMTLGDFAMFVAVTGAAAAPLTQLATLGPQFTNALAGFDRLDEVLRLPAEDAEDRARQPLGRLKGTIVLEDVDFEYRPTQLVLRKVSLAAWPGSTTAIVGRSGSGKSTLLSLITAFNRPTSGRVLVDGMDLSGVRLKDYREQLGVAQQDTFLFDGTVAENIALARPGATSGQIRQASQLANAAEFIDRLPSGLATRIGERGAQLSGGQRQRLAIARAILRDPRVLILDEAMSNLDTESEELIQHALQRVRRDRTTFMIAHRLSTVRTADQIVVLEAGRVVEVGRHDDLIERPGFYRDFFGPQVLKRTPPRDHARMTLERDTMPELSSRGSAR